MQGEKFFFRKKFFGGFNRDDVVAYIAHIAEERNNAIASKEMLESELNSIRNTLTEKQKIIDSYEKLIEKLRNQKEQPVQDNAAEKVPEEEQTSARENQNDMCYNSRSVIKIRRKKQTTERMF